MGEQIKTPHAEGFREDAASKGENNTGRETPQANGATGISDL